MSADDLAAAPQSSAQGRDLLDTVVQLAVGTALRWQLPSSTPRATAQRLRRGLSTAL